jgi:signal transduction histidine kinase
MIRSFRLRIFVIAVGALAAVLAGVLGVGWQLTLKTETRKLDSRLCSEAQRLARDRFDTNDLPRLEQDMLGKLHLSHPAQLLLRLDVDSPPSDWSSPAWRTLVPDVLGWQPPAPADPSAAALPEPAGPVPAQPNACELATWSHGGDTWHLARYAQDGRRGWVAANLAAARADVQADLREGLVYEIPLALLLSLGVGWALSSMVLRPVNRLRQAMRALTPQALEQRLDGQSEDREFRDLIDAYNAMLTRLQRSFEQASRFSADAAHELKTPLTILRGELERMRNRSADPALTVELAHLQDEVTRLTAITRKLLLLAQADAGQLTLQRTRIDLSELLHDLLGDAQLAAHGQQLDWQVAAGLQLMGDAVLLRQLLNNLLSNALHYTPPGGYIRVQASLQGSTLRVDWSNACAALAADQRQRLFQRFFRADVARTLPSTQGSGSGLGLSLSREIAHAHGGRLQLQDSPATEVWLRLELPAG